MKKELRFNDFLFKVKWNIRNDNYKPEDGWV